MIERGYPKLTLIQLVERCNHVHTVEVVIFPLMRSFNFEHYIFEAVSQ